MARPNRTANPMYIEAMQLIRRSNKAGAHDPRPNRLRTRAAADKEITRLKPLVADEKNIGKLIDVCDDISCFGGKYLDSAKSDNECSSASNASRIPACRTVCSTTGLGTVCYARSSKTAKDARSSCLDGRTASQRHESMGIRSDPYALDPGIRPRAGDALRPAAGKAGRPRPGERRTEGTGQPFGRGRHQGRNHRAGTDGRRSRAARPAHRRRRPATVAHSVSGRTLAARKRLEDPELPQEGG